MSKATWTFGRFNPPTEAGHGKLVSAVQAHAEKTGGRHYIFPSHSQDAKKNPLSHGEKVGAMNRLFPNANVVASGKVRTAIDAMKHLEKQGHTHVTMVVGSDRVDNFHSLLNKYRKKEYPGIKKVNVISAGQRDPDAEGAEGMSASKLRGLVAAGKKEEFVSHYSDKKLGAHIHDKVKAAMQMESVSPIGIFLLGGPGSGKDYVLKNIFSRFDLTEVQADQILNGAANELHESKQNIVINSIADTDKIKLIQTMLEGYTFDFVHVSVTNKVSRLRNEQREHPLAENKRIDKLLKAEQLAKDVEAFVFNNSINLNESSQMEQIMFGAQIEKLLERLVNHGLPIYVQPEPKSFTVIKEKYFPTVKKDKDTGLPQKYVAGLSKSTAQERARHFKEKNKLSDSDPRAYEPAPGDATAKTKPSKHTLAVRKMMGEQIKGDLKTPHSVESIAEKHKVSVASIIEALKRGMQVEMEHTKDEQTAKVIALGHLWEKPDYYTMLAKMEAVEDLPLKLRRAPRSGNITQVMDKRKETGRMNEGASDKSLSAKAAKSGISIGKLRTIFKRGVAAWNSGHRPGTTPQQWGHARVNSYINKGKTYYTADKDLREDIDIDELFEMQLAGTDEYRKHAIAMTPGQGEPVDAFPVKSPNKKPVAVVAKPKQSIVSQYTSEEEHRNCGTPECCGECDQVLEDGEKDRKTFFAIRAESNETKKKVDLTPTLTTKRKKGSLAPPNNYNSTLHGLPVSSRFNAYEETEQNLPTLEEAIQYHIENKISFTENVFRPGSEMFFEMISEAKRLYTEGKYEPKDEWEKDMLESNIGEIAEFEGQQVVLDYPIEEGLEECWKGYTQRGMKKKGDKMVPNCVPVNEIFNTTYPHTSHGTAQWYGRDIHLYSFQVPPKNPEDKKRHTFSVTIGQRQGRSGEKMGEIAFSYNGKHSSNFKPISRDGTIKFGKQELTQKFAKGSLGVISTVMDIAKKHAQAHGLASLEFAGDRKEPSRTKLYDRIAARRGGKIEDAGFQKSYTVPVTESSDPTNGKGIGKPWREDGGGAVYVRVGDGVRKISFSKSGMKKKYMDPAATRSFVARHRCLTNKDKTSASYWACRWPRFFSNSGKTWW